MQMIDILLKYILWHDFFNDLDDQSDFDKILTGLQFRLQNRLHSFRSYFDIIFWSRDSRDHKIPRSGFLILKDFLKQFSIRL